MKNKKDSDKSNNDKMMLPQNIVSVGERITEDKNIYIHQSVYKEIHKFTKDKTKNESGGILIGDIIEEFGKTNIIISAFIEAKYCEATPTTLKFTHKTWEYCHKEIDKRYPDKKIVGWIHTHPDFGIFLSEYDKFIQNNFFKEPYQIAYVVDPIQKIEGFYFWINENIEKCKGFYIFDKTGTKINAVERNNTDEDDNRDDEENEFNFKPALILNIILSVAVIILIINTLITNKRLNDIEIIYNQNFNNLNQAFEYLNSRINSPSDNIVSGNAQNITEPSSSEQQTAQTTESKKISDTTSTSQ